MRKKLSYYVILLLISMSLFSCDKKNTTIPAIDILTLPSATGKDFVTTIPIRKLQLTLSAPLMYRQAEILLRIQEGMCYFTTDI
jgi:hypothetical protein